MTTTDPAKSGSVNDPANSGPDTLTRVIAPKITNEAADIKPLSLGDKLLQKYPIPIERIKSSAKGIEREEIKLSPLGLLVTPVKKGVASEAKDVETSQVEHLMKLRNQGAGLQTLLGELNRTFAVVKYGSKIVVAIIMGKELDFMKPVDFHAMLANFAVQQEIETSDDNGTQQKTKRTVKVSHRWFDWKQRRQYVGRGVVFEPGGQLELLNDMLNLWRGFGVEPKQGDW